MCSPIWFSTAPMGPVGASCSGRSVWTNAVTRSNGTTVAP